MIRPARVDRRAGSGERGALDDFPRPLLLVNGATTTVQRLSSESHLGRLLQPRTRTHPIEYAASRKPWGADNDCFQGLDVVMYVRMLDRIESVEDRSLLIFVVVPDVVADARATLELWETWLPELQKRGLPPAFVLQDGQDPDRIPWDDMSALFIGGSTAYKLGEDVAELIREARERGIWVHVGRVNTERRLRYIDSLDVDSFDGSQFSRFPDTYLPTWLERLKVRQAPLPSVFYKHHCKEEQSCESS